MKYNTGGKFTPNVTESGSVEKIDMQDMGNVWLQATVRASALNNYDKPPKLDPRTKPIKE